MNFDPEKFGAKMAEVVNRKTEVLQSRIDELEAELKQYREKESAELTESVEDMVKRSVAEYLAEHPPEKGDPGADGKDGQPGESGVGVAGGMIDKSGQLILTTSDGRTHQLGVVTGEDGKDGQDGSDGADGLNFDDFNAHYDKEADEIVWQYHRGSVTKEVRQPASTPRHDGFWQAGMKIKCGHFVTHNGHLWYAKCDTSTEPALNCDDWQLAARKGADGKKS